MHKLIFERSRSGARCVTLPKCEVKHYELKQKFKREKKAPLAEVSEVELIRHYTDYSKMTYGVDDGFYPLGSCTMKYNPKINELTAGLEGFTALHPLQDSSETQGAMRLYYECSAALCEVTGMDAISFQASAGAHGEFSAMAMMKAYFKEKGETNRKKIIVPDSAHGTNPASAAMCGFEVVAIPSKNGRVDLDILKENLSEDVAGLMLTNPNTLGIYDEGILEITSLIHSVGGLVYYDGANLNAIMGISRPGDMGFDCLHLNLHKTFSTPHGGGGPGAGAIGAKDFLAPYLPGPVIDKVEEEYVYVDSKHSIGKVRSCCGNFGVIVRAYTYILSLGGNGLKEASENAVLNANYLCKLLSDYDCATPFPCMHEFVLDLSKFKEETGFSAMDVAKRLIDYQIHPPTMYFPLIVHEALMFEPTETETKETLDYCAEVMHRIYLEAKEGSVDLHNAPLSSEYSRMDEVGAARNPILSYQHD